MIISSDDRGVRLGTDDRGVARTCRLGRREGFDEGGVGVVVRHCLWKPLAHTTVTTTAAPLSSQGGSCRRASGDRVHGVFVEITVRVVDGGDF